jgi:hypothetical protein
MESLSGASSAALAADTSLGASTLEASTSAVSWPAIIAGALAAASASLILLALGSGLGLASVSPWSGSGASATTFTVMTAIWLIVVQWIASGLGGYLTGRLRTKWVRTHTHEVFFRDTAHGFITWALATVLGALVLTSAASSVIGAGVRAASTVAAGAAQGTVTAAGSAVSGYDVDTLFRSERPDSGASAADARAEATRILAKSLTTGEFPAADRTYLASLMAARTGVSQADAEQRLDQVTAQIKAADTKARAAADAARKAGALASIYTALSLLIGAFIASVASAIGGRQRDEHA